MKLSPEKELRKAHALLRACRKCPNVCSGPVHGPPLDTRILLVGQAPGIHEPARGRPFAHTAGKTLFKWLGQATGADEEQLREWIYFTAVARCFPGKHPGGRGDRPPSAAEAENCREHMAREVKALRPELVLAVGKPAIIAVLGEELGSRPLKDLVGKKIRREFFGRMVDVVALPHPSGVSAWPHSPEGKKKLAAALKLLAAEFRKYV